MVLVMLGHAAPVLFSSSMEPLLCCRLFRGGSSEQNEYLHSTTNNGGVSRAGNIVALSMSVAASDI